MKGLGPNGPAILADRTETPIKALTCDHPRSTVMESRRIGPEIYRRRTCGHCLQVFVSVETAPPGLKMPTAGNNRKLKPLVERTPQFNTDALVSTWRT